MTLKPQTQQPLRTYLGWAKKVGLSIQWLKSVTLSITVSKSPRGLAPMLIMLVVRINEHGIWKGKAFPHTIR